MGRKKRTPTEPSQIELRITAEFEQFKKNKQASIRIARLLENMTPDDQRIVLLQVINACAAMHPEQWGPVGKKHQATPVTGTMSCEMPATGGPVASGTGDLLYQPTSVCAAGT